MTVADPALVDARRALAEVHRDPGAAAAIARDVLDGTGASGEARAVAAWALGRSQLERDEVAAAVGTLRDAARTARSARLIELEAHVRSTLALALLAVGRTKAALRELTYAEQHLDGAGRARAILQRGLALIHLGRLTEAIADLDAALPILDAAGDRIAVCRILNNRGVVLTMLGRYDEAEADQHAQIELARQLDQGLLIAGGEHNLGFLCARRGDLPAALMWLDRARASYEALQSPARLTSVLDADRCDVLLAAGLTTEARAAAERSLDATIASGNVMTEAEARLRLARALLAAGAFADAASQARDATASFRRSRRYAWAALADYVAIQADILASQEATRPPPALLTRARRTAAELARRGWRVEALHVHTFAGRLALALDRIDVARDELRPVVADADRGTAELRVRALHATALLCVAEGQPVAARRALRTGMRELDAHRATLVARDLRAGAGSLGVELARLGLRLALREANARDALVWAERGRAASLRTRQLRPDDDDEMRTALAQWRYLTAESQQATLEGRSGDALAGQLAALEETIRDRARHARSGSDDAEQAVGDRALRHELRDAVLVEFVELEGRLHAVRVDAARTTLHELGAIAPLSPEIGYLTFAVRRLASGSTRPGPAGLARTSFDHAAAALDRVLLRSLALPPGAPIVIVPTGSLHNVLWGALESTHGRAVTIAPSASSWLRGRGDVAERTATGAVGAVGLAAGPDLDGGRREVIAIAGLYRDARCLVDADATTGAVLDLLATCDVVHLAAHGTFRADSPLFSSIRLADGPLSIYELERRELAARTIVLPACDAGMASVHIGDELLGTAAALLGMGVASVLAPATIVPDEAMIPLMIDLHKGLRAGARPAQALAAACERSRDRGDRTDIAAAAAFACIGTA